LPGSAGEIVHECFYEAIDLSEFEAILDIDQEVIDDIDFKDYSSSIEQLVVRAPRWSTKQRACLDLLEKIVHEGKVAICWCIFRHSIRRMQEGLAELGITSRCIYGEVSLDERQAILDGFRDGRFQVLLTNPHTLAESVSLHSICHDAVYYEYSYNLVHLLQSKDRIHRLGLMDGQYTQYRYLQDVFEIGGRKVSLDGRIYSRLMEKEQLMLDAIDKEELEESTSSAEDIELIFGDLFD